MVKAEKLATTADGDMEMDGKVAAAAAGKKPAKKTLSDFSAMGNLLDKIENKIEKQANH